MFSRIAFWIMNIWISVVLITGLVNFFFHFDIVMEWSVTNHIITYLRTQSLALRIMLIVISLIVWVFSSEDGGYIRNQRRKNYELRQQLSTAMN